MMKVKILPPELASVCDPWLVSSLCSLIFFYHVIGSMGWSQSLSHIFALCYSTLFLILFYSITHTSSWLIVLITITCCIVSYFVFSLGFTIISFLMVLELVWDTGLSALKYTVIYQLVCLCTTRGKEDSANSVLQGLTSAFYFFSSIWDVL